MLSLDRRKSFCQRNFLTYQKNNPKKSKVNYNNSTYICSLLIIEVEEGNWKESTETSNKENSNLNFNSLKTHATVQVQNNSVLHQN